MPTSGGVFGGLSPVFFPVFLYRGISLRRRGGILYNMRQTEDCAKEEIQDFPGTVPADSKNGGLRCPWPL